MDLLWRHFGSGDAADREAIACCSVRKRPDSRVGATVRSVFGANESGEALVSGHDLVGDRLENSLAQPVLLGFRHARGKLFYRLGKRAAFATLARDVVCFGGDFLKKKARRHQAVIESLSHVCGYLIECM